MKKILVADDEKAILGLVRAMLSRFFPNHKIYAVEIGEEAVEWLKRDYCNLLITDFRFKGGISGIDVIREARLLYKDAPKIILMSGSLEEVLPENNLTVSQLALEAGADALLAKPFGIEKFLSAVRAVLSAKDKSP